jgi:bifunctional non-homologous end joining protein LigD
MPVAWEEIGRLGRGDAFSLRSAIQRLARLRHDPWQTIDRTRQTLPA